MFAPRRAATHPGTRVEEAVESGIADGGGSCRRRPPRDPA